MKRVFRGPWLWIVVAVLAVVLALELLAPGGGHEEVPTSRLEKYIAAGEVDEITFIDGKQAIEATLDKGTRDSGDKVIAFYVNGEQQEILAAVKEQVEKGTIEESNSKNPKPGLLSSLLVTLLPFVLIIALFIFLMNNVQGGGKGVMQFGKSKAKMISKDMPKTTFSDVAGCDEGLPRLDRGGLDDRRVHRAGMDGAGVGETGRGEMRLHRHGSSSLMVHNETRQGAQAPGAQASGVSVRR